MTDIFLQRDFDEGLTPKGFAEMLEGAGGCLSTHRVDWVESYLSGDGLRLVCLFSAPDAESARIAMRQAGVKGADPWSGTVHDSPIANAPAISEANVIVERRWDEPVSLDDIQAIEDAGAACLEARRVEFVRTYFSLDRTRMVCLYKAPDVESVREAQRLAGMPVDLVWSFQRLTS